MEHRGGHRHHRHGRLSEPGDAPEHSAAAEQPPEWPVGAHSAGSESETPPGHDDRSGRDAHAEHDKHAGHDPEMFRRRFWLTLALTLPVVAYSEHVQELLGFTPPGFPGDEWVGPVLGTVIFVYGGGVFLQGAYRELRARAPGMMLLIALAISVAFVASAVSLTGVIDFELWWELSTLVAIMLLGHWQEMKAIGQARGALAALAELLPDMAERVTDTGVEEVPTSDLSAGDLVLVRPGGKVPSDGRVEDGRAEVDESMVTGESRLVTREEGDRVVAGTVVAGSSIRVRVDAVGEQTALAGIQRLVAEAQRSRSRTQVLADRFAALLFYIAVSAGAVTFIFWAGIAGDADFGIARTVTVLVIACPHALGLAVPLVIALSTSLSSRQGILVKDRLSLERMRQVDTVLFDKTGTLTLGQHAVTDVASVEDEDEDDTAVLALAAAVESDSEHPVAQAIVAAAHEHGDVQPAHDFRAIPGRGAEARVDGELVAVGGPALLRERDLPEPQELEARTRPWRERGASVLHVVREGRIVGAIALEDRVRPESRHAVDALHELGVRVVMITGDARQVADAVAEELGIDEVFAEVLPEEKDQAVLDLQRRGERVAMVGDGVNDAPALARADVGIAIGAGTDVAIESAGVVLASNDPRAVVSVVRLSRASYRKMVQNLGWAAGYNVVALPLAAGVLAPVGVVLAPAVGAILMSTSTIIVALNSQLLRRLDLRPGA
jgi:P-type Cu2+ transporter